MRNTKDLAMDIAKLRFNALIYGGSGTGKTTSAGTFPEPYFFDFNRGMLSLRGEDVKYDTYVDEDLRRPDAFRKYLDQVRRFKKELAFKTVVIDDLPTMAECVMRDIQLANGTIEQTPNLHEWQIIAKKVFEAIYELQMLDCHLVVIALEECIKDDVTGEIVNQPLIMGRKLSERSPGWFDEVYRMQVGRDKNRNAVYQILTKSTRRYVAKSRLDGKLHCFNELEEPDFEGLMKKIKGGEEG